MDSPTTLTIETEVVIAAPRETVWAALIDLAGYAAWNPYLVRVDGVAEAGSEIVVHSRPVPGGEVMVQPVAVITVDAPRVMRWEGGLPDRSAFKGDHWWQLEAAHANTTRLRHYEHFTGSRAPPILDQHGAMIEANFRRFNEALKAHVEGLAP